LTCWQMVTAFFNGSRRRLVKLLRIFQNSWRFCHYHL
jgi:hypothetical protein